MIWGGTGTAHITEPAVFTALLCNECLHGESMCGSDKRDDDNDDDDDDNYNDNNNNNNT